MASTSTSSLASEGNIPNPKTSYSSDFKDPTPAEFGEIKATSAVLWSAAFFVGQYCKDYNEDYMLCKQDSMDPAVCALEGRKVTRCALDLYV
jgi:NADH dehydrogenase (ubiquinone) 1 alpha subcomplex subunit 8